MVMPLQTRAFLHLRAHVHVHGVVWRLNFARRHLSECLSPRQIETCLKVGSSAGKPALNACVLFLYLVYAVG